MPDPGEDGDTGLKTSTEENWRINRALLKEFGGYLQNPTCPAFRMVEPVSSAIGGMFGIPERPWHCCPDGTEHSQGIRVTRTVQKPVTNR